MIDCSTPSALVEEYERYSPLGSPGAASLLREATAAVASHVASTALVIFDDALPPRAADTTAQYAHLSGLPPAARFAGEMAEYHRRALATNEPLASMLRSKECLDEIAAASASGFAPSAASEACRRYRRGIAEQLVAAPGHPLAGAARDLLAAEMLGDRLLAAEERHRQGAAAAAARAEAERQAEQAAADEALDAAEAEAEVERRLQSHGLPRGLREGEYVVAQLARCRLLATAKRRLRSTSVDAIRMDLGTGRGLFGVRDIANSIGECSIDELRAVLRQLDAAEGREDSAS